MDLGRGLDRLDAFQRRHRASAFVVGVIKKFGDDASGNLAVLITYYLFFSIFPLLLALSSILGFVLKHHASWQRKVNATVLKNFPFFNGDVPQHGRVVLVVVGTVLAIYSGLAVAKAAQHAWDVVYEVPKMERPGILPNNLRALRLVAFGGLSLIVTTVATSTVASAGQIGFHIGPWLSVVSYVVTLAINIVTFAVVFRWLTVRRVTFRDVLPGAVFFAMVLAGLQAASSAIISHTAVHANATYGTFGTVVVLLTWFHIQTQALLFAAQINVVKQDRLWPRSLRDSSD